MDYNFRNITDNDYWYIYELKKNAYRKYVEVNFGAWDEVVQRKHFKRFFETYKENTYIVQTNGKDIGFYNDCFKENGNYIIITDFDNNDVKLNVNQNVNCNVVMFSKMKSDINLDVTINENANLKIDIISMNMFNYLW